MTTSQTNPVDMDKLQAIAGKIVGDLGSVLSSALVVIGDKLGLYKAMASAGPPDPTRAGRSHPYLGDLRQAMAHQPGRQRLCGIQSRFGQV